MDYIYLIIKEIFFLKIKMINPENKKAKIEIMASINWDLLFGFV